MLRFVVNIGTTPVILTAAQVADLANLLSGIPVTETKWVGSGKGDNGGDYVVRLAHKAVSDILAVKILPEEEYNLLKFMTANAA
jgi:hypothetical protein